MRISNKNKRNVGRPSLRCITVRSAFHHHALNFSVSIAKELNLQENDKVTIKQEGKAIYLCFGVNGYNIRVKHNGGKTTKTPDTFTCSSVEIVNTLLSLANAQKFAKFIVSSNCIIKDNYKCFLIISKPLFVD